ncbi:MAG TPA: hypothetical protein VKW06_17040 [Candidatus Angelobacter sp.]|nr:hypothetical protein [Candidatus Angelobacter sp.]
MRGLAKGIVALIFGGALFYGGVALLDPWALHMGGRSTPFLTWTGYGKLVTKSGAEYPLYVSFYPSSHSSRLHVDGLRPVGGLQGTGWLCTARGVKQRLDLSGTIFGHWRTTDGNLVSLRLLEPKVIDVGQGRGFFDLYGRWQGPQLVMDSRTSVPDRFRSGLVIERPAVKLDWGTKGDFDAACAAKSP